MSASYLRYLTQTHPFPLRQHPVPAVAAGMAVHVPAVAVPSVVLPLEEGACPYPYRRPKEEEAFPLVHPSLEGPYLRVQRVLTGPARERPLRR